MPKSKLPGTSINDAVYIGLAKSLSGLPFDATKRPFPQLKTLHVRVAEARGLMARDFAGRSDPFVVLDLTGRWASHLVNLESNLAILQKRCLLGTAYAGN